MKKNRTPELSEDRKMALKYSIVYLLVGILWILLSDPLIHLLTRDTSFVQSAQTLNGWVLILATSFALYGFIRRYSKKIMRLNDKRIESEERYRRLVDNSPEAIGVYSHGKLVFVNEAAVKLIGAKNREQIIGKSLTKYIHPAHKQKLSEQMNTDTMHPHDEPRLEEYKFVRMDGSMIDVEMKSIPITYNEQPAVLFHGKDVTESKKAQETIRHMAYHDALTGLPNRRMFLELLTSAIIEAEKNDKKLAVMFIDLDRFKWINDTLGHEAGDLLLKSVARRLTTNLDEHDIVSRQGGDEFTILLPDTDQERTETIAKKLLDVMTKPFLLKEDEVFLTISIGISMYPESGENIETLINNADAAMYRAKEQGNNYQFYAADIDESLTRTMLLERELRKALELDQLSVHYQPQWDIQTGDMIGVEALLRWNHPELGSVSPGEFIPVAEDTGLIIPIGEWVLYQACKQMKAWQDQGFPHINISVNLSPRQFQQHNLTDMVDKILKETGLDPQYLELEITESIAMHHEDFAIEKLEQLKKLGVQIAIDDFGTGYSSLNYLKKFPVQKLKIDQSFVRDIDVDRDDETITRSIIAMAKNLQLKVIAEGVENEHQFSFLKEELCDEVQGFLFSPPRPAEEMKELFETYHQNKVTS
ncbi:MAG: EAL domain-containing protein [Bacillaceae bacterium]|nr:EAL domain-containing protein [Bacillaceae bacterium]